MTKHNMRNENRKMGINQFHKDIFHNLQVPKRINQEPKNPKIRQIL